MQLTLARPDDWHLHLRDGDMLNSVVAASAAHFSRALIMPNLLPPVVTAEQANAYRQRIMDAHKRSGVQGNFNPQMTLYLTETTNPDAVVDAAEKGSVLAMKLYPAGATTNSDSGVANLDRAMPVLEAMARHGIVLCVHGEVTDPSIDIFDREACFIERVLEPLRQSLPELKIVMEHITTQQAAKYVASSQANLAASITPHHLMINRNHMLVGGIRPHYYCLPILKREEHRQALIKVATSGDTRFFLGTDSAPHSQSSKENACGCAGVFNAPNTLSCLATIFEEEDALDKLEAFTSINGAKWYGLEINDQTITLEKRATPVSVPEPLVNGRETVVAFDPARPLYWHVLS